MVWFLENNEVLSLSYDPFWLLYNDYFVGLLGQVPPRRLRALVDERVPDTVSRLRITTVNRVIRHGSAQPFLLPCLHELLSQNRYWVIAKFGLTLGFDLVQVLGRQLLAQRSLFSLEDVAKLLSSSLSDSLASCARAPKVPRATEVRPCISKCVVEAVP